MLSTGAWTTGASVIDTLARSITPLHYGSVLSTRFVAAFGVHLFSFAGIPVSASKAVVGGVLSKKCDPEFEVAVSQSALNRRPFSSSLEMSEKIHKQQLIRRIGGIAVAEDAADGLEFAAMESAVCTPAEFDPVNRDDKYTTRN